jgi:hypothetical protein
MAKRKNLESCPKCKSIFIQYDENSDECYCLMKECNHNWSVDLDFSNIKNPYLRASIS